jgi:hypothetical protein
MGTPCPRRVHLHQYYFRYFTTCAIERFAVTACFRCPLCFAHFSVIPAGMMPYRPLSAGDAQRYADQRSRLNILSTDPPLPAEDCRHFSPNDSHRANLQRYWTAFCCHSLFLAGILGIALDSEPAFVWRTLRHRWGTSIGIHRALRAHHTNLTKSYLSLKPWWLGGLARGWRADIGARAP